MRRVYGPKRDGPMMAPGNFSNDASDAGITNALSLTQNVRWRGCLLIQYHFVSHCSQGGFILSFFVQLFVIFLPFFRLIYVLIYVLNTQLKKHACGLSSLTFAFGTLLHSTATEILPRSTTKLPLSSTRIYRPCTVTGDLISEEYEVRNREVSCGLLLLHLDCLEDDHMLFLPPAAATV